ncbi:heavy-metal-associated domain-containing protein [Mycetocola zhadangensis]|uniref:Heavy-metal-associated domain-containing protein n=2 Tax=Mycetocola zhadangensis TaxID=1164595 RepID=A0A3L7IX54_9MICO|nr:heavy-metal-associated domain-containing protein [Mycetocola zhadangensis]
MTRARCIVTVMNTLERVKGVDSVDVDLNSGGVSRVTVLSSGELDSAVVGSAIDEAGYALVGELAAAR